MIRYINLTREEQAVIDLAEKDRAIQASERAGELEDARLEGEARGVAIGEARGRTAGEDEGRRQMIELALDQGRSVEEIAGWYRVPASQVLAWAGRQGLDQ